MATFGPLMDALDVLRTAHSDMTLAQAQVFLALCQDPKTTQVSLAEKTGLTDSAVSRIIAILSNYGNRNTEGLDLVRIEVDPDDRRYRTFTITGKGARIRDAVTKNLGAYSSGRKN